MSLKAAATRAPDAPTSRRVPSLGRAATPTQVTLATLAFVVSFAVVTSASAQGVPGIVISVPPSGSETATPPKPRAQPKRRAAPKKRRRASTNQRRRSAAKPKPTRKLRIEMLVNDVPITNYEIRERAKLMALSGQVGDRVRKNFKALVSSKRTRDRLQQILREVINANRGQPRNVIVAKFERRKKAYANSLQRRAMRSARSSLVSSMSRKARKELVEERLKLQEAKRLGVTISKQRVDEAFAGIAQRNKMTSKQFSAHLGRMGASAGTMKARIKSQMAWGAVISRRFRRLVSVSQRDVDSLIGSQGDGKGVRLRVQRVTLPVPDLADDRGVTARLQQGQQLQRQIRSCNDTPRAVQRVRGAALKDIGSLDPNTIGEPTRTMLLTAEPNEALAPSIGNGAVELYVVCGRNLSGSSFEERQQAERRLERRELEILGRRHLADLRRDAHIERR